MEEARTLNKYRPSYELHEYAIASARRALREVFSRIPAFAIRVEPEGAPERSASPSPAGHEPKRVVVTAFVADDELRAIEDKTPSTSTCRFCERQFHALEFNSGVGACHGCAVARLGIVY
jgi:hypothetical protein